MMRLQDELLQSQPFASLGVEAHLSVVRTADLLQRRFSAVLKPWDLSPAQYNVLRILRGHRRRFPKTPGLACGQIGQRLLTFDPDVTRLCNRLVNAGWVQRDKDETDRRVVLVMITTKGLALLDTLDPVVQQHDSYGFDLPEAQLRQLVDSLAHIRSHLQSNSQTSTPAV